MFRFLWKCWRLYRAAGRQGIAYGAVIRYRAEFWDAVSHPDVFSATPEITIMVARGKDAWRLLGIAAAAAPSDAVSEWRDVKGKNSGRAAGGDDYLA